MFETLIEYIFNFYVIYTCSLSLVLFVAYIIVLILISIRDFAMWKN